MSSSIVRDMLLAPPTPSSVPGTCWVLAKCLMTDTELNKQMNEEMKF